MLTLHAPRYNWYDQSLISVNKIRKCWKHSGHAVSMESIFTFWIKDPSSDLGTGGKKNAMVRWILFCGLCMLSEMLCLQYAN